MAHRRYTDELPVYQLTEGLAVEQGLLHLLQTRALQQCVLEGFLSGDGLTPPNPVTGRKEDSRTSNSKNTVPLRAAQVNQVQQEFRFQSGI